MLLEDYFTRNNITDDRLKIINADCSMAGKVQSFFSAVRSSPQPPVTFNRAMELVREKFSGSSIFFESMHGQDIDAYVNHFHRACREFVPKDEAATIRQFRHGLTKAIQDKLVGLSFKTLEEIIHAATQVSDNLAASEQVPISIFAVASQMHGQKELHGNSQGFHSNKRRYQPGRHDNSYRRRECFHCGSPSHLIYDCPYHEPRRKREDNGNSHAPVTGSKRTLGNRRDHH